MRTTEEIWADDLLDRSPEANLIASFIQGSADQARRSPTKGALTLAIDAGYGEGKTFFLRRLAEQLKESHPVAFVDAWSDDLADEPLTALIATLKRALAPWIDEDDPDVGSKFKAVMEKSGQIAKIASLGLLKRGLGLLITSAAVEASSRVLEAASEDVRDAVTSGLDDSGENTIEVLKGFSAAKPLTVMEERVKDFESGRKAMEELKAGLIALVEALEDSAPVIIIIDELDRCRPTYAIKLLEEIKHLFDIPGLVFIFGMHTTALGHSVRAAYGSEFDGASYLRRFIQRRYRLAPPDHEKLIENLLSQAGVSVGKLIYPRVSPPRSQITTMPLSALLSEYMRVYGVSARDAIELVGLLETATALCGDWKLSAALLIPLAIGHMKGLPPGTLPEPQSPFRFDFFIVKSGFNGDNYEPHEVARLMLEASRLTWKELADLDEFRTPLQSAVFYSLSGNEREPLAAPPNYPLLLSKVAAIKRSD